ncbi:hypothetical protein [Chitinophaga arvensicola]|nr:hypothetical protein [Chitinophaga arvensicola]
MLHSLLIVIAFTVRYNAVFYPVISAIAYLLTSKKLAYKATGILLPVLLVALFISYTRNETQKYTGTKEFSVFGGWQLANNALYMYPFIELHDAPPAQCAGFHQTVIKFFEKAGDQMKSLSPADGAFYLRDQRAPLKVYLAERMGNKEDSTGGIQSWGSVSPIYSAYGSFLISGYPFSFTRHFIFPNFGNYWVPPLEKLEVYNLGSNKVSSIAGYWFDYPSSNVRVGSATVQKVILGLFPVLFGGLNFLYLITLIGVIRTGKLKTTSQSLKLGILLFTCLLIANAAFGILASPIVFRYMAFPMVILIIFSGVLMEKLDLNEK